MCCRQGQSGLHNSRRSPPLHTPPWPLTRAPRGAALLRLAAGLGLAPGALRPLLAALDALPPAAAATLPPTLAPGRAGNEAARPAAALAAACRACQALAAQLRLFGRALALTRTAARACQALAARRGGARCCAWLPAALGAACMRSRRARAAVLRLQLQIKSAAGRGRV
jgi:hypothetical protein